MEKRRELSALSWIETTIGVGSIAIAIFWLLSSLPTFPVTSAISSALFIHAVVVLGVFRLLSGTFLIWSSRRGTLKHRRAAVAIDGLLRTYGILSVLFSGEASIASVTGATVIVIEIVIFLSLSLRYKS